MAKLYKIVYKFKDGTVWGPETHDVALSAEQIAELLKFQQEKPSLVLENQATGERKGISEIYSIEIVF